MIETVPLGSQGLMVSRQGLGCMGMSAFYGPHSDRESLATIDRALELGVTMLDTADVYGPETNERLLAAAIVHRRDRVVVATKFGVVYDPAASARGDTGGNAGYVRRACEASLTRLGADWIDLYYLHRLDSSTPIEETVGAMAELVAEGKVRYLGLSEVGPETIRRAHAVHPLSALQTEYSVWSREPAERTLPVLRELGIGFVPYSPLGRGFLTGRLRSLESLAEDDFRRVQPRFDGANLDANLALVGRVEEIAAARGVTPGQVALAWVHSRGADVVPIPGTSRSDHLEENVAALDQRLSEAELERLDLIGPAQGERYADMSRIESG